MALTFPILSFSQSIGIKTGTNFYKPYNGNSIKFNPVVGIIFKYAPKRLGIGIEPGLSTKTIILSSGITTDNAGNKITSSKESKSTVLEVPVYGYFKAIDKDFKLNIETGMAFYGKSQSLLAGFYAGYKINKISLGFNYRINCVLSGDPKTNNFTGAYQSAFISAQYNF